MLLIGDLWVWTRPYLRFGAQTLPLSWIPPGDRDGSHPDCGCPLQGMQQLQVTLPCWVLPQSSPLPLHTFSPVVSGAGGANMPHRVSARGSQAAITSAQILP